MAKLFTPYRVATYLLLIFCAAHTLGGMLSTHSYGLKGDAVLAAMQATHFDFNGSDVTWYGFHFGFGMMTSVLLLLLATLTWHLANTAPTRALKPVAWAVFVALLPTAYLSFAYFFAAPGVFSTLAAGLTGYEALRKYR
ncbi:MAG TPA: hypothetical protein VFH51_17975 [Myxococcota bacterium]|nr:hypothetical protein [Myxococcota bacterium]